MGLINQPTLPLPKKLMLEMKIPNHISVTTTTTELLHLHTFCTKKLEFQGHRRGLADGRSRTGTRRCIRLSGVIAARLHTCIPHHNWNHLSYNVHQSLIEMLNSIKIIDSWYSS